MITRWNDTNKKLKKDAPVKGDTNNYPKELMWTLLMMENTHLEYLFSFPYSFFVSFHINWKDRKNHDKSKVLNLQQNMFPIMGGSIWLITSKVEYEKQ
jgi:hypothetical protein